MTHPCDGHDCDHCYLCDVVGVCCATVLPPAAAASASCAHDSRLHDAIVAEATTGSASGDLIQANGGTQPLPVAGQLVLPAGSPPASPLVRMNVDPVEEVVARVLASRRQR
jgi:hypothetical protein